MQIEALLTETSADAPCGADLEYDADFMALDQAVQGKPEQQFGDTIIPAVEPNWVDVRARAEALFSRTKDLRVAMWLTRALLNESGLSGLSDGLLLTQQLLTRYWDQVYPHIDEGDDPTMRLNVLSSLIDGEGLLRDARASHVIAPGPKGRVTVRDVLVAQGKLAATPDNTLTLAQIQGVIRESDEAQRASVDAARACLNAASDIQALLNERLGTDRSLDLRALTDVLGAVVKTCNGAVGEAETAGDGAVAPEAAATVVAGGMVFAVGDIRSREDAIRALDRVCEFIERAEPSNPAPLLIRRAQRLISKNFIEIIEDLAPASLDTIKGIAGI